MGHAGEPEHGVEPQQEDLRQDRGVAEPAHRRRTSVPLSRWHRDEADLGWQVRNVSLLVASAVNSEGFREILGICEGAKEDKSGWSAFLRHLVDRGLNGVQLIISDACRGLMESAAEYLPDAQWQRCMVHFYRNVFSHVPATRVREVSHMLKAIHAQESRDAADRKARTIVEDLRAAKMHTAADLVERSVSISIPIYASSLKGGSRSIATSRERPMWWPTQWPLQGQSELRGLRRRQAEKAPRALSHDRCYLDC